MIDLHYIQKTDEWGKHIDTYEIKILDNPTRYRYKEFVYVYLYRNNSTAVFMMKFIGTYKTVTQDIDVWFKMKSFMDLDVEVLHQEVYDEINRMFRINK